MDDADANSAEGIPARIAVSKEFSLQVWTADCWRCRYCEELVFFPPALRAMAKRFGNRGYYHPNWRADEAPLLIRRGASVDHMLAVTRGGAHVLDNFVTACWTCNLSKSNHEHWTLRPQRMGEHWDGMLAVFKGLTASEADSVERDWLRAMTKLGL